MIDQLFISFPRQLSEARDEIESSRCTAPNLHRTGGERRTFANNRIRHAGFAWRSLRLNYTCRLLFHQAQNPPRNRLLGVVVDSQAAVSSDLQEPADVLRANFAVAAARHRQLRIGSVERSRNVHVAAAGYGH